MISVRDADSCSVRRKPARRDLPLGGSTASTSTRTQTWASKGLLRWLVGRGRRAGSGLRVHRRGKSGDQTFEGVAGTGNRAILRHAEQERVLRVFTRVGKVPGSDTKTHRYLGTFTLDSMEPYVWRRVHGEDGQERNVIVFRLRADGDVQHAEQDVIPPAEKTRASLCRSGRSLRRCSSQTRQQAAPYRFRSSACVRGAPHESLLPTRRPAVPSSSLRHSGTQLSIRAATAATVAIRHEAELTQAYKAHWMLRAPDRCLPDQGEGPHVNAPHRLVRRDGSCAVRGERV